MAARTRKSFFIPIRNQQIFVEIDGQGPYMVMTHGLGAGSNMFQPLVEIFSRQYTTVRIDWPGSGTRGMSSLAPGGAPPLSVPGFVADLESVLDFLNVESAVLVGHSLGGIVSMQVAAKSPKRVDALVVIGAGRTRAVDGPVRSRTLALAGLTRQRGVWPRVDDAVALNVSAASGPLARALLRQVTGTSDPEGYAQMCDALAHPSHVDPDYSKIVCPTCVVGSLYDNIAPVAVTEELHRLIAQSGREPHLVILGTGHMQIIEDVDGVAAAIRKVLNDAPRL